MTGYTHTEIANKIIDMGMARNFIAIAIGMLENRYCDLDGWVGKYAKDMDAIKRKAMHELDEEADE